VTLDELWQAWWHGDFHERDGSTRLTWLPSRVSDEGPATRALFEVLGVAAAVDASPHRLRNEQGVPLHERGGTFWRELAQIPVSEVDEDWLRTHFLKIRIDPDHLLEWVSMPREDELWHRIVGVLDAALRAQQDRPELKGNASATARYLLDKWGRGERYRRFREDVLRRIIAGTYRPQRRKERGIPGLDELLRWRSQRESKKSRGRSRRPR